MSCESSKKCRTCLCDSHIFHQLYDYVDENYKILEILDDIVPQIKIKTSSQFSSLVCQSCVDKLVVGYKFQKLCIETNRRLHEMMGLAETKLEILDPLEGEDSFKMKIEIEEDASFECEIKREELEYARRSDNDNDGGQGQETDNDTDSSNEKLSVLKERKANKSPSKPTDVEEPNKNNRRKGHFPCTECGKVFGRSFDLKRHAAVHAKMRAAEKTHIDIIDTGIGEVEKPNKGSGSFPCEVCGKVFDQPYLVKRHSSVHSLTKPHECEICKYRFATLNILEYHMIQHDGDGNDNLTSQSRPEGFKCGDCPRRFEKQVSLSAHRQVHTRNAAEANYPCMVCQRNFMSVRSLTEHITNKHPEVEKHKCDQCDKTFVLHAHLVEHLNRHKGNKNLVCLICEKEFRYPNTLKQHMRTHSEKSPNLCPQCGKSFRTAANLRQHMERHTSLKKYQCPECPNSFKCRSDLASHKFTHTNGKPHLCDICGSGFKHNYTLLKHKVLHSGLRPFKCDQCSMTFTTIYHLRRHMRTHTGEKPYKCKYCERAYSASGDLTKHLRSHVGENTYMCDQCPMAFKYQAELRQHQSEHYKMAQKPLQQAQKMSEEA